MCLEFSIAINPPNLNSLSEELWKFNIQNLNAEVLLHFSHFFFPNNDIEGKQNPVNQLQCQENREKLLAFSYFIDV